MQPNPPDGDHPLDAIERRAADWLVLRDRGMLPAHRAEFEAWLAADELHAEIYAELEETWQRLGDLKETSAATPFVADSAKVSTRRRRKLVWFLAPLAAAAAVALAYLVWRQPASVAGDFSMVAATEVGGLRELTLPDGSVVQLNTDSAVSVEFTPGERGVQLLRGEAHFHVAKNPARPFVVRARGVAVRAVGTAFDVRMRTESVEVLVTEGKVRVNDSTHGKTLLETPATDDGEPLLLAGRRAVVRTVVNAVAPALVTALAPTEIGRAIGWQSRRLEFVATPLAEIVAELNRYNRHKLVIADPRLASRRFGGTFAPGDHEELVRLLEADFGVVAARSQSETELRLAP